MIITTKLHTLSVLLLVMQKTNFAFSELIDELHSTMQVQNIVSKKCRIRTFGYFENKAYMLKH
jgi:hypothetical protein